MYFLCHIFYVCLRFRFLDVENNIGTRRPIPAVSRILCSNVRGMAGNLSDLTVASSQYDILLCSLTLVSDMRHVSELLVPGFGRPVLLCQGKMPRVRRMAAYVRHGYGAFLAHKCECGCCEMLGFWVCGVRQNIYMFSICRNPITEMTGFFFSSIDGCRAGWVCLCLFPVCGLFEWPSSGVVGFNYHEPSWSCSLWFRNCFWLWLVGCWPNPCTWWNTWPLDDWCSWPSTGRCCNTDC